MPKFYPMLIFAMDAVATSLDTEYEADALEDLLDVIETLGMTDEEAWQMYEQFAEWRRQAVSDE